MTPRRFSHRRDVAAGVRGQPRDLWRKAGPAAVRSHLPLWHAERHGNLDGAEPRGISSEVLKLVDIEGMQILGGGFCYAWIFYPLLNIFKHFGLVR